jgi:hypothetical protein
MAEFLRCDRQIEHHVSGGTGSGNHFEHFIQLSLKKTGCDH